MDRRVNMSTITRARLWKDVGFTEGCMEVPSASDTLPSYDLEFTNLNPTKARMFNELRLPEDYVALQEYSYMEIVVDNNNGSNMAYYGWIDDVEMISDTDNAPITAVKWHVDLWRTYFANAEFGSGMVKRRPVNGDQPPQQPSYRYMAPGTPIDVYENDGIWWVIVALTKETEDPGSDPPTYTVTMEYRMVPVSANAFPNGLYISSSIHAVPLRNIFLGDWDELWGIDPQRVISVFASPICPLTFTGNGQSSSTPISISGATVSGSDGTGYYLLSPNFYPFYEHESTFGVTYMTNDTTTYCVRGLDGETVGTLPWGVPVDRAYVRLAYSTTSAYVQIRFSNGYLLSDNRAIAHQYGLVYNIPCLALDVTENTWSSYVYSGQRQYDMEQRQLASDSSAVSGGLALGASALTGAASGAMLGSVVPGVGTLVGGIVGALGGALTGAISTGGNYLYETMYKNDEMQRMEDYAHANQADGLLLPGSGLDSMFHGCGLTMVPITMDSYSATQFANDLAIYGAKVCEPKVDCSTLISAGGPIQIENLIVTGDIPPNAKAYIKQRFAQGVIIV